MLNAQVEYFSFVLSIAKLMQAVLVNLLVPYMDKV